MKIQTQKLLSLLLSTLASLLLLGPYQCYAKTELRGGPDEKESLLDIVDNLLERISSLEEQVTSLQEERKELVERVQALGEEQTQHQRRLQDSCITQDTKAGGTLFIEGCNVNIRSGAGTTTGVNGFGNLIVGYNEQDGTTGARSGSHNLIVGVAHGYTSHSGIVSGRSNEINSPAAAALGGHNNAVSGDGAAVLGGNGHTARGTTSVLAGGNYNVAASTDSCVFGGGSNTASAEGAVVVGGKGGQAVDVYSVKVQV